MIGWENLILSLWNTCSNSNSIAHFLYIDLPRYLQERRKENSDCAAWEHSQLPLKPRSVLGRFEILTLLLNLLEVPGFNIHQAHLNTQYMAKDCILLFQTHLSPLCSLPSSFCRGLKAVHPEPAAFEISAVFSRNILGGCPCRQDTVPVLWHLCWPSPEFQEQSKIPTHNCQPFGLLVSDCWRKHLSDKGAHFKGNRLFFPPGRQIWCVFPSPLVFSLVYLTSRLVPHVMSYEPWVGGVSVSHKSNHWIPPWRAPVLNHNTGWDCPSMKITLDPHSSLLKVLLSLFTSYKPDT